MAKKSSRKGKGFLWGLILGAILAVAAVLVYQNYFEDSDLERETRKLEKQAKKEIEKATEKAKDLFD